MTAIVHYYSIHEHKFCSQVAEVAASLNSEDVFILETPSKTWIWKGNVNKKFASSFSLNSLGAGEEDNFFLKMSYRKILIEEDLCLCSKLGQVLQSRLASLALSGKPAQPL